MSTMLAAVFTGLEQMELRELPLPELEDEDSLLLKVHACAVCGSDIRIFHYGNPRVKPPQIIGHEIAGEVVRAQGCRATVQRVRKNRITLVFLEKETN